MEQSFTVNKLKFREYDNVFPKVLKSLTPEQLEHLITEFATVYNLIDLQYSTTTLSDDKIEYSAMLLLQEKNYQKLNEN